jgi:hypothetical protein
MHSYKYISALVLRVQLWKLKFVLRVLLWKWKCNTHPPACRTKETRVVVVLLSPWSDKHWTCWTVIMMPVCHVGFAEGFVAAQPMFLFYCWFYINLLIVITFKHYLPLFTRFLISCTVSSILLNQCFISYITIINNDNSCKIFGNFRKWNSCWSFIRHC